MCDMLGAAERVGVGCGQSRERLCYWSLGRFGWKFSV